MMEMLQLVKYTLRQQELNFTDGFVATEEECATLGLSEEDSQRLRTLFAQGKYAEIQQLTNGTWGSSSAERPQDVEDAALDYGLYRLLDPQSRMEFLNTAE